MAGDRLSWVMMALLVGGCAATAPPEQLLLVHGPAEVAGVSPAWCYSTLADADCFTWRVPEATDRLIGAYVPVELITEPDAELLRTKTTPVGQPSRLLGNGN